MSALLSRRAERSASSGQFDPRAAPDERANFWFDYADQVSFVGRVTVAPPVKDDLVSAPCPNATSLRGGSRRVSSFFLVALGHECFVVLPGTRTGTSRPPEQTVNYRLLAPYVRPAAECGGVSVRPAHPSLKTSVAAWSEELPSRPSTLEP